MKIERANAHDPSPEELAHLERLRALVERALADGKLSKAEMQAIQTLMYEDHQVTVAELATVRAAMRQLLGDAALEYDWQ